MNDIESKETCEKMIDFFAACIEGTDIHPQWLLTTFVSMIYTSIANIPVSDKFIAIEHVYQALKKLAEDETKEGNEFPPRCIDESSKP